ncbi:N-(5'-phosphoribosyl)anthranilate isomerase [Leptospira ryugenii]|uniref:N-(5'-phosphoribosyl)anthranilate isomerase n=1 Tax=Leptospira ryugenii TaxID=1917863 RepID=A0A2P2DZV0_9LEPT|nr:phosphoribosylanthranilate isomerase [Leptospira ryugenii]GBF50149.1 N-(5'-phosphoribosyl)anthranilate isomerase [Leptospira ryugenii]
MGTKIKICGIKDVETFSLCRELSVDFVGLNFSPKSPRRIQRTEAEAILRERERTGSPKIVFLFFENEVLEIENLVKTYAPDLVQLIAGDPIDITPVWNTHLQSKTLLPAFRLQSKVGDESLLCPELPFVILDSYKKDLGGGSGHTFPWEYAKEVKRPYLLAGGINPQNVEDAIRFLKPYGIDVASGVETDGKKDASKIKELVNNVRNI